MSATCFQVAADRDVRLFKRLPEGTAQHPFLCGANWEILGQCVSQDNKICLYKRDLEGCVEDPEPLTDDSNYKQPWGIN